MEEKDRLDRFLDKALAECGEGSPREGLEGRILARVREPQHERARTKWFWVAGPVAVAAALIMFFVNLPKPNRTSIVSVNQPFVNSAPQPVLNAREVERPAIAVPRNRQARRPSTVAVLKPKEEPKLTTFPSPDEGEAQAQMLLRFVTSHPEQAKEVVREEEEFQQIAKAMMDRQSNDRVERER